MADVEEMMGGMLNQVVGRKGCGWLKDGCYVVIESNRYLWEKLFCAGFIHIKKYPKIGEEWTKHTDNKWLLIYMVSWFEFIDEPMEEEYYQKHPSLALQIFTFGVYAGIVISGMEIENIVDPRLYDEDNYKEYVKEQDRIAAVINKTDVN